MPAAITATEQPAFGRTDALARATVLDALRRAAWDGEPVGA